MVEVSRRVYEEVIGKIVKSRDREELMDQFSGDLVFYSSVLRDIARGRGSANYRVLNGWAKNRWLVEKFIIEQARSVLSNFGIRELGGGEGEVVGEYRGERFVTVPVVVRRDIDGSKRYVYLLSLLVLVIGGRKYVVEGGDNLWDIARKFNITVKSLKDANGLANTRLDIGDVLVIPENNRKQVK